MTDRPLFLGLTDDRERPTDEASRRARGFTMTEDQRATGMHVIGGPGSGKSKFLELCIRQDIDERRGVCLIDPHGELYTEVLTYCASIRHARTIIPLNLSTGQHIIGFNPFTAERGEAHTLVNRAIAALIKAWGLMNTNEMPTLESVVSCVLHAIIESGFTIAEAEHFLSYDETTVRDYLASRITNPAVRKEWREVSSGTRREWREEWRSTRSKLLRFLRARPLLRFLALADSLDLRRIMDEGAVLLVNLQEAEGVFDEADARTFGSLLVSKFFAVARQRIRQDGTDPRPFYLYCDEFQEFVSPDVPRVVAQGRKMGLSLVLAHQYIGQLAAEDVRLVDAVMGAVRTRVVFGLESDRDAALLVPSLFRGRIDYHEVKRIDYSVKFWPVYDRDESYTKGEADTTTSSDTSGFGSGMQWTQGGELGVTFEGANFGSGDSESHTTNKSVTNAPIYRPVPFLEGEEKPWSLEEQKHRLAEVLMLQLQRMCWVKPRDALAVPVLVPRLKACRLPASLITDYEAEQARKAGAVTPAEADRQHIERTKRLEQQALQFAAEKERADFDAAGAEPVHSPEPAYDEPATAKPASTRGPAVPKSGRKSRSK